MACVLAGVAGAAQASSVEFRIVERRSQTAWNAAAATSVPLNDNLLNLSVQARVVGGAPGESLGNFGFNIILTGEGQANGTLATAAISNALGQYTPTSYGNGATIGRFGLAHSYTYLAGLNAAFNGSINASSGSWTETADNDIGLITGSPTAQGMLDLFDTTASGFPDTYPGTGTSASIDSALAGQYLGADGNFVQIYNFNYTISSSTARNIQFHIDGAQAQTFQSWALANTVWGPGNPVNASSISTTDLSIAVTPAPGAMALLGLGGLVAARRRRA
jgi:MYXO-CTERM domain-containing protein